MNGCEECIYMQDGDCIRKSKVRRATEKCEHYVNENPNPPAMLGRME